MKGYKTLAFNVAAAVLTALVAYNWGDVLPERYAWAGTLIVAFGNFGLRFVTTTPVGKAE